MRPGEGALWIVAGAVVCVLGWRVRLGTLHEPGPGFVAFATGLFLVGVGIAMLVAARIASADALGAGEGAESAGTRPGRRFLVTAALLFAYALFLEPLGYLLTTLLVMWGLFVVGAGGRVRLGFAVALVTAVSTYVIFGVWLQLQFPREPLPW